MKIVFLNIKKLRELQAITRDVMASDLDMSLSGYSKIERGEVDITLSKLYKIAEILNVRLDEILNFDPSLIFSLTNSSKVQETGSHADLTDFHEATYKEKYIKLLEKEVDRLGGKDLKLNLRKNA